MNKIDLDNIIEKHKAQPVGYGYIDIIVSRDKYRCFISDIVRSGYKVNCVSWWEWCPDNIECKYGLGGPKSRFYEGWFSELSINVDDLKLSIDLEIEEKINTIINLIETKTISFADEIVTFMDNQWLTPAFWLDIPNEWRNSYTDDVV